MKILIPTDFSVPAENAARYALALAKELKADILMCNAFKVPAEAPMASQVAWPLMDYAELMNESTNDLDSLVKLLSDSSSSVDHKYCPNIAYESGVGSVCDVVSAIVKREKIDLVVMGMAGAGGFTQFVLGSNSKEMMEKADFPVLLVPYEACFRKVRKIVFATDLSKEELGSLQILSGFSSQLGSDIVIAHVTNREVNLKSALQQKIDDYFRDVISNLNFSGIKYEYVWNIDIDNGLDWITEQKDVDIVALTHSRHHLIHRLFVGSHTQKLARHTKIPLLVFSYKSK